MLTDVWSFKIQTQIDLINQSFSWKGADIVLQKQFQRLKSPKKDQKKKKNRWM